MKRGSPPSAGRSAACAAGLLVLASTVPGSPGPSNTSTPRPPAAAAPARVRTPAPRPRAGAPGSPTDFSGLWELDAASSSGGAANMSGAVLEVTQKGDRIWIQPLGRSRTTLVAEEVVVDGRSYEKSIGEKDGRRGTVTAKWGNDLKSLWLEVAAGTDEEPRAAVQRSVWRLSEDRTTWVRETITLSQGSARRSRIVFRRFDPKKRTPAAG